MDALSRRRSRDRSPSGALKEGVSGGGPLFAASVARTLLEFSHARSEMDT